MTDDKQRIQALEAEIKRLLAALKVYAPNIDFERGVTLEEAKEIEYLAETVGVSEAANKAKYPQLQDLITRLDERSVAMQNTKEIFDWMLKVANYQDDKSALRSAFFEGAYLNVSDGYRLYRVPLKMIIVDEWLRCASHNHGMEYSLDAKYDKYLPLASPSLHNERFPSASAIADRDYVVFAKMSAIALKASIPPDTDSMKLLESDFYLDPVFVSDMLWLSILWNDEIEVSLPHRNGLGPIRFSHASGIIAYIMPRSR